MTSLNIVAHPDDDLLFLNPDILTDLESGDKVWVVYLTSGDEGKGEAFVGRRKQAVRAAYQGMEVSLFDLELRCNLYPSDPYGDLYRLWHQDVTFIRSLKGVKWELEDILVWLRLLMYEKPDVIRTHDPDAAPAIDRDGKALDHLDHIYTAKLTQAAAKNFPYIPLYAYTGYPIRHLGPNVEPDLADRKLAMWRCYQEIATEVAGEQWDVAASRCYKRRLQ